MLGRIGRDYVIDVPGAHLARFCEVAGETDFAGAARSKRPPSMLDANASQMFAFWRELLPPVEKDGNPLTQWALRPAGPYFVERVASVYTKRRSLPYYVGTAAAPCHVDPARHLVSATLH